MPCLYLTKKVNKVVPNNINHIPVQPKSKIKNKKSFREEFNSNFILIDIEKNGSTSSYKKIIPKPLSISKHKRKSPNPYGNH